MELFLFLLYMAPTIVAAIRGHTNAAPIGIVNFLLGWTFLGWVGCLAWSATSNIKQHR